MKSCNGKRMTEDERAIALPPWLLHFKLGGCNSGIDINDLRASVSQRRGCHCPVMPNSRKTC